MEKISQPSVCSDSRMPNEAKPPELDKILADVFNKFKRRFTGQSRVERGSPSPTRKPGDALSSSALFLIFLSVLLVIWLGLGFFIVKPAEEAVILRFGHYVDTVQPGPHWVPLGIESYTKINVQQVNSFSFGADYLTQASDDGSQPASAANQADNNANDDTDKNVVYAELSVQYRIVDPQSYLFHIIGAESSLEQAAAAALSEVIGTMRLNAVLTVGRDQLTWAVKKRLQSSMNAYGAGIEIVAVNVRKIQAPEEVADAFLDVVQAGQDEQRYIQQAQAYARKVIPIAEGNRNRILAEAQAYQQEVILKSQADVSHYLALLHVYQQAPVITKDRMYLETMQTVLSNSSKLLLSGTKNQWINLPLDRFFSMHKPPVEDKK